MQKTCTNLQCFHTSNVSQAVDNFIKIKNLNQIGLNSATLLKVHLFNIRDAGSEQSSIDTLFWSTEPVQQLLPSVERLAAVILCVTPSGMALFDVLAGSHCTAAAPPLNSISEKHGFDHCLCSANKSPLFTLHDSIPK